MANFMSQSNRIAITRNNNALRAIAPDSLDSPSLPYI